jgi:hypothetical protein
MTTGKKKTFGCVTDNVSVMYVCLQLAMGLLLAILWIMQCVCPSCQLYPVPANKVAVNHEAQSKKHIAFVGSEIYVPLQRVHIDPFLQDA